MAMILPWLVLQKSLVILLGWLTAKLVDDYGKGFLPMGYRLHLQKKPE